MPSILHRWEWTITVAKFTKINVFQFDLVFDVFFSDNDNNAVAVRTMGFPGTATKPGTFTDALKDKTSPEFKQLEKDFCAEVRKSISSCTHPPQTLKIYMCLNSHAKFYV